MPDKELRGFDYYQNLIGESFPMLFCCVQPRESRLYFVDKADGILCPALNYIPL